MKESPLKIQTISIAVADHEKNEMHSFNIDLAGIFNDHIALLKERDALLHQMEKMRKAGEWMFENLKPIDGTTNGVMPSRQAWIDATAGVEPVQGTKPITE